MKHRNKKKILSRKKGARKSLIKNLAQSLIFYEQFQTTEAKAKTVKAVVEKLITIGKKNNLISRRKLLSFLNNEKAVKKIFEVLAPKYLNRNGGYLRINKTTRFRKDGTPLVIIKFI